MEIISNLITSAITDFISTILESTLNTFTGIVGKEMQIAMQVLNNPLIRSAVNLAQMIAASLLVVKVAVEALRTYILFQNGDSSADPGGLLKRTALAAAAIGSTPWLVKTVYTFGNELALAVSNLSATGTQESFFNSLINLAAAPLTISIIAIIALIIWILILVQTAVRGVELGLLAAVGPVMAVGLTSSNEGIFSVWWRELIVLSVTQALQTLMIKGFLSQVVDVSQGILGLLFMIAWLWVAFKTPNFLRQFAYHSGLGGAIGGAAQTAGTWMIIRKMMTKGV
jgi:hypothetical protein